MSRSATGARVRPLIVSCALALAELHFPKHDGTASPDHAHLLLTGRIDAWPGYWDIGDGDRQRLADLLSHRGDDLASGEGFRRALRACAAAGELDGYHLDDDGLIRQVHGMPPALHADRLLAALGDLRQREPQRRTAARPGRYRSVLRGLGPGGEQTTRAVYNLSDVAPEPAEPLILAAAPRLDIAEFGISALCKIAERVDAARGQQHRRERVEAIFGSLLDADGHRVEEALGIRAGGAIQVLQAPTAAGKTVTLEVLGTLCAEAGVPVAIVVPTRASALRLAREIETNMNLLSIAATCAPLLAPGMNMKDAEAAAMADASGLGQWAYRRLGYGCALSAAAEVEEDAIDAWNPGEEPCQELYEISPDGRRGSARTCPWQGTCGKFQLERAAAAADVIVTAHQTFRSGTMKLSFSSTTGTSDRLSVEEFLLRRCQLIVIDELDQFQRTVIGKSARHLVLADGPRDTKLRDLDTEFHAAFGQVQPEVDGTVRPILSDLRLLAEGYVANLAHGWLPPVRAFRPGWRTDHWIVARGNDAWITAKLLGRPDGGDVTSGEVEAMRQFYLPQTARVAAPPHLPGIGGLPGTPAHEAAQARALAEITDVLAAVTGGCRDATLPTYKAQLSRLLVPVVADELERGKLVDRMLRRCYLEPLRSRLAQLFFHTSQLRSAGADSAEAIADALGGFSTWSAMPASPLGRLFLAFNERLDPERPDQARLSVAAFGGDPHGYTLYLGELTARARAGVPRAVLGLSATPYLPGAPHHHIHTRPAWIIPDADPRGVTILSAQVFNNEQQAFRVSGVQGKKRSRNIGELAEALYRTKLAGDLAALEGQRWRSGQPGRDRILIATTSYDSVLLLAEGFKRAGAPDGQICVLARPAEAAAAKDPRWHVLAADRVEQFPTTGARILVAPLAVVERGVNVLEGGISALGLIYMVIRPVPVLDEPAELLAHVNHQLWSRKGASAAAASDPLGNLQDRVADAGQLFDEIVCSAQFFRSLPGWVQEGVVAEIMVGLVQLVGRARRGGTPGEIRLVDDAFFDARGNSHLPALIKRLQLRWEAAGELSRLLELYGPTLSAFFEFADRHLNSEAALPPGANTC